MDYTQYFELKTRSNGAQYICLKEDTPEALEDLIRNIHHDHFNGCWPNDWIYYGILDAFKRIKDDPFENVSIEGDVYSHQLINWLLEPYAIDRVDLLLEEPQSKIDLMLLIREAQYQCLYDIFWAVNEFLNQQKEIES